MQYLKFGLVFHLNFFHHLDLYQVKKPLLKLTFTLFFLFTIFTNFINFEENLVHRLKISLRGPAPF